MTGSANGNNLKEFRNNWSRQIRRRKAQRRNGDILRSCSQTAQVRRKERPAAGRGGFTLSIAQEAVADANWTSFRPQVKDRIFNRHTEQNVDTESKFESANSTMDTMFV